MINFELKEKQFELFDLMQGDNNCCFIVSIRSGKTLLCFLHAVQTALEGKKNIAYVAPTQQMLKNIFIREFVPYLADAPYCEVTDTEVRFENGSRIFFLSADKPERLRGITLDLAIVDEFATMKETVITEVINRTAKTPNREQGKAILITTPAGKNWAYDFVQEVRDNQYWNYRKYDIFDMGVLDKETIKRLKETKDETSFLQDCMVDFSEVKGKIFKNWNDQYIRKVKHDRNKTIYMGMDFNANPMTAVLAHKINDTFEIFDEIYLQYSETEEMCQEIRQRYGDPAVFIFPDASGGQVTASSGKSRTNFKILKRYFGEVLKVGKKNPPVMDTINEVNEMLRESRIIIDPRCKNLLKTMDNYSWKEGSNQIDKNGYDHMADCLRYLVHGVFPLNNYVEPLPTANWGALIRG